MRWHLRNAVNTYIAEKRARFHMPGHKGHYMACDITEVEGADSLFQAKGALLALEQEAAALYGAGASLLSAGGATLCIQAMFALCCGSGGKVIASRSLHRSALNAMVLLDLVPVWLYPSQDAGASYIGRWNPQEIRSALKKNPDAKAVYVTSPDYYGVMSDLSAISEVCRAYNVPLLVDNAHGAHLKFIHGHPMDCGAFACADSLHKTMPAMTGGAVLHLADAAYADAARGYMAMFGSTSPSYPIMLSCEQALAYGEKDARRGFARTARRLTKIAALAREKGFILPEGITDPAKLSLGFASFGISSEQFGQYIRKMGIEPEYMSEIACVLMANDFNSRYDYARLMHAVASFQEKRCEKPDLLSSLPRCEAVLSVREATFSTSKKILVENAVGCIAARETSPCPPGMPIVMSGEYINEAAVRCMLHHGVKWVWCVVE